MSDEVDLFIDTLKERSNRAGVARPDGLIITAQPPPNVFARDQFRARDGTLLQNTGGSKEWIAMPYGMDGEASPVADASVLSDRLVGPYDEANSRFYKYAVPADLRWYDVVCDFVIGEAADRINIGLAARLRYDDIGYVCRYTREAGTDSVCICKLLEGVITTIEEADLDDQLLAGSHSIRFTMRDEEQMLIIDEVLVALIETDTQLTQPDSVGFMAPGALADLAAPFHETTNPVVNYVTAFRAESVRQPVYL